MTKDNDGDEFSFDVFEAAASLLATWLARFRDEEAEPNISDKLMAGYLAGALAANKLLVREMPQK